MPHEIRPGKNLDFGTRQMPDAVVRFRIVELLAATTLVAAILGYFRCWNTAYETHGAVGAVGWVMMTGSILVIAFACLPFRRTRLAAFIVILGVCIWAIFSQHGNAQRLESLRNEVRHIVEFVEVHNQEWGGYPRNLADFHFENPSLSNCIWYRCHWSGDYEIWFNPTGETSYGHCYTPKHGYYFEDD